MPLLPGNARDPNGAYGGGRSGPEMTRARKTISGCWQTGMFFIMADRLPLGSLVTLRNFAVPRLIRWL